MSDDRTQQPMSEGARRPAADEGQPVQPALTADQRAAADRHLDRAIPQNNALSLPGFQYAVDRSLRADASARQKLVLAQYLRLVAAKLDGRAKDLAALKEVNRMATEASNMAVGQMLSRLRSRERLCHQIMLWRENLPGSPSTLAKRHTAILIAPNVLSDKMFQKVVNRLLHQTNATITRGEYRSFLFLPFDSMKGALTLRPYLRMAQRHHVHVLGALPVENSVDSLDALRSRWQMSRSLVGNEELEALSHSSIIANHIEARPAKAQYFETTPVTAGLEYAYAAQMAKYFQRKRDGHWYVPVLHPHISPQKMKTVNTVNVLPEWKRAVEANMNFAYTVAPDQDDDNPGVRIYGATTVFPREGLDLAKLGSQSVPYTQSQARVTKNRINFYLLTMLERLVGGQYDKAQVQARVNAYLAELQIKQQILGFDTPVVDPDGAGNYHIKTRIEWSPQAERFEIDTSTPAKKPEPKQ